MTDLKPCPFCGVTGEILSDGRNEWALFKHKDSCLFPNIHKHEIPASDFAAWNTRTERTCRNTNNPNTRNFICSKCGESYPKAELTECPNYCPNCGAKVVE